MTNFFKPTLTCFARPLAMFCVLGTGYLSVDFGPMNYGYTQTVDTANSRIVDIFSDVKIEFSAVPPVSGTVDTPTFSETSVTSRTAYPSTGSGSIRQISGNNLTPVGTVQADDTARPSIELQHEHRREGSSSLKRLVPVAAAEQGFPAAQVSYQEDLAGENSSKVLYATTTPVAKEPMSRQQIDGMHELKNLSASEFESSLQSTWGSSMRLFTSSDNRFLRVELPNRVGKHLSMILDRQTNSLTYEGDPSLQMTWHTLMGRLDYQPVQRADGTVLHTAIIHPGRAAFSTVKQAAYLMGMTQDASPSNGEQGRDTMVLPANSPVPQQNQILPGEQGLGQGIKNTVKIVEDPVTGMITLIGDKEDLEIVRKIIMQIAAESDAAQPEVARIELKNTQSQAIVEDIQSLYDSGYAASKGTATITAVTSPNALVVIGQSEAIEAIRKIVSTYDVEATDMADGFKSFHLQHMSAIDAKVRLDAFFAQRDILQGENQLASAPVITIADYRTNTLTVKGSQRFIQEAATFLAQIDTSETGSANLVKIIPLRNTLASELAFVIQDAISGQQTNAGNGYKGANQQNQAQNQNQVNSSPETSQLHSSALTLKTVGEAGMITSGVLFDVRITADTNSNSLIVTAPEESMELVEALILQLDRIPNAETQIKVFQILNGDATTLLTTLQALFASTTNQVGGGAAQTGNLSQLPLQGVTATDGATLVNLRFGVDTRTNTIIASGPAGDLQVVEDLLSRLDESQLNDFPTQVYRLSNAPVLDVADAINAWLDSRSTILDEDPRAVGGLNQTNREVIVVPEVVSNSLIIQARPEYLAEITNIIVKLDRRPPMVMVKVLIAEVDLSRLEEFGVDVGVQDSLVFDRGTSVAADGSLSGIGFPFNNAQIANRNATFPETIAGQALSFLGTGRTNSTLGYGGMVLSAGNESVNVLIRALEDKQAARVLAKPQIMTMENLQGRVIVGASVPRVSGTTNTNFGVTQNIEFVDVGVILEVTPRVSQDGMIVMAVGAKRSRLGPESTAITIAVGEDGTPIKSPQIIEAEATTTLMARSGQTVVFSGLIEEEKEHIVRGVPVLSTIPGIGSLFKYESDIANRTEIMIIMTPYLVDSDQALDMVNNDAMDRMHWCLCDVAEVYGDTNYEGYQGNEGAIQTYYPDADPIGLQPQIYNSLPLEDNPSDFQTQGYTLPADGN